MSDLIDAEGFRTNVGIVLMRGNGQVFLGRRTGGRGWQFPQGGVRQGEEPEQAVYRELQEEIGLTRQDVELLGSTADWLRYRLPPRYVRRNQQPLCIGQKQRWFLLRMQRRGRAASTSRRPRNRNSTLALGGLLGAGAGSDLFQARGLYRVRSRSWRRSPFPRAGPSARPGGMRSPLRRAMRRSEARPAHEAARSAGPQPRRAHLRRRGGGSSSRSSC